MELKLIFSEIVVQIIGFGLVFFILRKLLWGRISQAVEDRQSSIAKSMNDLKDQKKSLEDLEADYRQKMDGIQKEARVEIQKAVKEGQKIAQEIQEKAREDALKQVDHAKSDIEQEIKKARAVMRNKIVGLSTEMARQAIKKNLSIKDDEALIDQVMKEAGS